MAEERFDQPSSLTPLSEKDLAPIEPLTPRQILRIGQKYVEASFHHELLRRRIEETAGRLDAEVVDEHFYQTGRRQALQEVLEELGQDRLVSIVNERVNQMFEQS